MIERWQRTQRDTARAGLMASRANRFHHASRRAGDDALVTASLVLWMASYDAAKWSNPNV